MIFKRLIVGPFATNCYIFGSEKTREVVIIDPGSEPKTIINSVDQLDCKPIFVLLTHAHFDHGIRARNIKRHFKIPVAYNKKDHDLGFMARKPADKWIGEGDLIKIGQINLHILSTPGHSPGSLSYYTKDVKEFNGQKIDGIIFTGDLIFRREIGRTDMPGSSQSLLFSSIRKKIMNNYELSDNFIMFPGHKEATSIGEERELNHFKEHFL